MNDSIKLVERIESELQNQCLGNLNSKTSKEEHQAFEKTILSASRGLSPEIEKRIQCEYFGFGPLEKLMKDRSNTEIIVNDWNKVFVEKSGELIKSPYQFMSPTTYQRVLERLYFDINQEPTIQTPFINANWRGFRAHITLANHSTVNTSLTLRKLGTSTFDFCDLVQNEWCSIDQANILKDLVATRSNLLVVGPTGSGKTTVLSALLGLATPTERAVILEDTDELRLPNTLSNKLVTIPNQVSLSELLRQSLRMRPDRIVVGEVRSGEAKDLLLAMSTGHSGSMATLHASNVQETLKRLEMLIQLGAPQWSIDSIRQLILLTIKHVITVGRRNGKRKLISIDRICSLETFGFTTEPVT